MNADCTLECTGYSRVSKTKTGMSQFVKWLQNLKIEGAEELSKTK